MTMSPRTHHAMKRRTWTKSRGYTSIEVLMAMTVFAVGAASVIAMQRASVQGNLDARKLDTANGIARDWIERIRRDATMWTLSNNISGTQILSVGAYYGAWALPIATCPANTLTGPADGRCPAFDLFGHDLGTADFQSAAFCVNIRLDNVTAPVAGFDADLIRADVRVYWPRQLTQAANGPPAAGFCSVSALAAATGPDGATGGTLVYHFVLASTLVRRNPNQ